MNLATAGAIASICTSTVVVISFIGGLISYAAGVFDRGAEFDKKIALIQKDVSYMAGSIKDLRSDVKELKTLTKHVDKKIGADSFMYSGKFMKTPVYVFRNKMDLDGNLPMLHMAVGKIAKSYGVNLALYCDGDQSKCDAVSGVLMKPIKKPPNQK